MDSFGSDRKLSELGDIDFQDFLDDQSDMLGRPATLSRPQNDVTNSEYVNFKVDGAVVDSGWLDNFLDDRSTPVSDYGDVLSAVPIDAIQPQHVKSEHSYSLANGTNNSHADVINFAIKMEPDDIDMETGLFQLIDPDLALLSESDASTTSGQDDDNGTLSSPDVATAPFSPTSFGSVFAAAGGASMAVESADDVEVEAMLTGQVAPCIKTEPFELCVQATGVDDCGPYTTLQTGYLDVSDILDLPPTPPSSSSCSSDSEAGESSPRRRSSPSSPTHCPPYHTRAAQQLAFQSSTTLHWSNPSSSPSPQPLFTSPIPSSGILILSEEEKRTLIAEGYTIPTKLPLTKQEEKNLKKIRRKIKNKISAQESRRKKKEYLEHLEKRVEFVSMENMTLRKKLDALESNNRSLASQLQKLQSLASRVTAEMQAATCVTVS